MTTPKAIKRVVKIEDQVTVADLAQQMSIKANELIAKLMGMGVMAGLNQILDLDRGPVSSTTHSIECC